MKVVSVLLVGLLLTSCSIKDKSTNNYGSQVIQFHYPKSVIESVTPIEIYDVFNGVYTLYDIWLLRKYGYLYDGGKYREITPERHENNEFEYLTNREIVSYENLVKLGRVKCESVCFTYNQKKYNAFVKKDGEFDELIVIEE